jgi:hypothetical protein
LVTVDGKLIRPGPPGDNFDWNIDYVLKRITFTQPLTSGQILTITEIVPSELLQPGAGAPGVLPPFGSGTLYDQVYYWDSSENRQGWKRAFASAEEILEGTLNDIAIAPEGLQSRTLTQPTATPTEDANYLVALNSQGKIAFGFIPFEPLSYFGSLDITQPYVPIDPVPSVGSFGVVKTNGTADGSWGAVNITGDFDAGDLLIWNGTGFDDVEQQGAFLPLSGGTHTDTAIVTYEVPAGAAPATPVVRLDGSDLAKSAIDNFTLNGAQIALPALAAITVVAGAVANNEVDITIANGPADVAYTITLTYETDTGPDQVKTAAIPQYATADMAANILAAAVTGDIVAMKTGPGVLHVSLGTATQLIAMAPTVA